MERTDHLPTQERVSKNMSFEAPMRDSLRKAGVADLEPVSKHQDMVGKVDCLDKILDELWQLKIRESGYDVLYDRWEPYFGISATGELLPGTKIGRDHLGDYKKFACLSYDKTKIRVIKAEALREKVQILDDEWAASGYELIGSKGVFYSQKLQIEVPDEKYGTVDLGAEIRRHKDSWYGHYKILYFFPEQFFSEEEIDIYPMIWE